MKQKHLSLLLALPLILSACGSITSVEGSTSSFVPTGDTTSVVPDEDYDAWCDTWSQEGHLYIHYLRTDGNSVASWNEYQNYAIWIWQNAPQDLEGSLWAASSPSVQAKFEVMSTSWMRNIGGKGADVDQTGVICDIDLTRTDLVGGKSGKPTSFVGAKRVGFLIVDQTTMDGGSHWTSDGGANTYIYDFNNSFRANGAMHIFCVQGSVSDFTFAYDPNFVSNPVVADETGMYRSAADINSSTSSYTNSTTSADFSSLGVGYQIFVPSFRDSDGSGMGDIRGIIDSLDYLEELGVDVLWLTPVQASESYHGYDVTDYYEIDEKFGTLYDYRELLFKAHQKGMKVLMDLVLNHTSKNNVWFKKSQKAAVGVNAYGENINYRDMYHWKYKGDTVQLYDNGTYKTVSVENHPDWYKDGESNYYYYGKFGSGMAELNYDCQATRDLVIDMAKYWLGFGLDGFRLDAVKHIYMRDEITSAGSDLVVTDVGTRSYYDNEKMESVTVSFDYSSDITKNVNFWKEFASELKGPFPNCFLVGENFDGYGARIAPYYNALDSQFDFSLYYHNLEWLYQYKEGHTAGNMGISQQNETYAKFSGNGSTSITGVGNVSEGGRANFINGAFTSNHDVMRAINHVCNDTSNITGTASEIKRAKMLAASTILSPGISWIYYGDELGMSGNTNLHEGKYTYANNLDMWYRQPFKWGDSSITPSFSFNSYTIEWDDHNKNTLKSMEEQASNNADGDMLDLYKSLTSIKKLYGKNATYTGYESSDSDLLSFKVTSQNGVFDIYINSGVNSRTINVSIPSGATVYALEGASQSGSLPPYSVLVAKH